MSFQSTEKEPPYHCDNCDFTCIKKSGWNRHIITAKHIGLENHGKKKTQDKIQFICDCGKTYADRSGLWRHSRKCLHKKEDLSDEKTKETKETKENDLTQLLINENQELKKIILELIEKKSTTNVNVNVNDNNKIVNLNFIIDDKHNIIGCL